MLYRAIWCVVFGVLVLVSAANPRVTAAPAPAERIPKWEYKTVLMSLGDSQKDLDALFNREGEEGWRFVAILGPKVVRDKEGDSVTRTAILFERPKK